MDPYHRYYDVIYSSKNYAGEADVVSGLLLSWTGCVAPGLLLDIGCGTGNHALEFARRGWTVTGIDIDTGSIEVARQKVGCQDRSLLSTPEFRCCGISDLSAKDFDAAVSLFNVINYISSLDELESFFLGIAARLADSRPLVLDCWNGLAALRDPPRRKDTTIRYMGDTIRVVSEPDIDPGNRWVDVTNAVSVTAVDGSQTTFSYEYRSHLWTPAIICQCLSRAGFELTQISSWERPLEGATERDWKLLFTCRKKSSS